MAYNKTSEERKWNYWKEQEEKKLRELGMEEEKIQKLRQMDREDFLEERRYREHLDETMQDMDSIKEKDSELFANAEFRVYSDDEMKRLNAEITQMDVQIARCLLIHQMLGTRISDTLTLRPDCLTRENGQDMIEIYQVKTKRYKKPISKELAKLLQSSIEYTQEKFGDSSY